MACSKLDVVWQGACQVMYYTPYVDPKVHRVYTHTHTHTQMWLSMFHPHWRSYDDDDDDERESIEQGAYVASWILLLKTYFTFFTIVGYMG